MNLEEIYNKLQTYLNQQKISDQTDHIVVINTKDKIYYHIAKIVNNNIGDNLFKPLYWRQQLAPCKISGIDFPQFLGELKINYVDIGEIFALFGIIDLNLRDVPGLGHARILINDSAKFTTVLDGVLNAKNYVAIAITEEGAGSDLHALETVAVPVRNGYILNGRKCFIARIDEASRFIVFSYVVREKSVKKFTAFLVSKNQKK
ncbi:MAG: acyl-CoA dehydrogenase family protein [Candidatus Symbiodolus clandestinus]